jgi:hypothetical protein
VSKWLKSTNAYANLKKEARKKTGGMPTSDKTTDLRTLQQEIEQISYNIRVNKTNPKKIIELQAQRAPLIAKAQHLQAELNKQKKEDDINNEKQNIKKELMFWVLEINGNPTPISSDLTFKYRYSCGHEEHLSLGDLIPFEQDSLYRNMREGNPLSNFRICQKCRAERIRRAEQDHYTTTKQSPFVTWKLRYRA